jgi:hypothetical protein
MDLFGFIITRHVLSEKTNQYWNHSLKCIRKYYPLCKIIIIDDNSVSEYVKSFDEYSNVEVIQSEYKGRGELLPYYYFYKHPFFQHAVIIHDSVFFHMRIPFEKICNQIDVLPFWHFPADNENASNSLRLINKFKNHSILQKELLGNEFILGKQKIWQGCFGVQSFIQHSFVVSLEKKYNLFSLLENVKSREDRCCLERIFGILFSLESKLKTKSLFGNIHQYQSFHYTFDTYQNDLYIQKKIPKKIVKVWTGR